MRGSACVEVMTTLHGSAPSLRRRAEGCVPPEGSICSPSLGSVPWVEWEEEALTSLNASYDAYLHDQAAVIPPIVTPVTIIEDPRSRMDRLERRIRQMRDPDEMISWDDPDDVPVATLPVDEAQLLTLFPLSLSGMTQRWYASLESSRRRTWEDLAQEFLRQYSFSGDTSVTRRELEFLRQGSDESVSSFISRWREKAAR
ncbi:hypothetical protein CK203_103683 [Vitis vinifera]|uniref:Retrotransposon gag domain-containing protein n=1 Tax=Vitis vinifera TaxID=29760 RepID=A0A438DNE3_VITVI|nr:hypothetical protein CK203_103683 [Vitis vinifera]